MNKLCLMFCVAVLAGCSVVGKSDVEIAPYTVLQQEAQNIEIRRYDRLVLVSTDMNGNSEGSGRNGAFNRLFNYISGDNVDESKISMTAPVIMDNGEPVLGTKIPMTAPVLMDGVSTTSANPSMSFVLPGRYTLQTAPVPTSPQLRLSEKKGLLVATIRFSGLLSESNVSENQAVLEKWLATSNYTPTGAPMLAGYNPPFTLPPLRRNEVLIPVRVTP